MSSVALMVIVLVVYMAGMLVVGWLGRGTAKNFDDFVTAAKKGSFLLVCGSYLGSHLGNGVVVGGASDGAVYGLGGAWYGVGACLSYIVFSIVIAKRLYRSNCLTISELLNKRYGGTSTGTIFAVINCGAAISIMAGQIVAGKNLFQYLGLNPVMGAVLCAVIVFLYSATSGQWGVMMTDAIQVAIILVCTFAALFYMGATGAFTFMKEALPASNWDFFGVDFNVIVTKAIPSMLYGLVSCASFQRNISAKDEKTAVRSAFWGGIILIPYVFLPVLIGMYGRALYPTDEAGTIIFRIFLEQFPPVLGAFMIAAVMAACMSTVDSQLIYVTASMTKDIYATYLNKNASQKTLKTVAMIVTVIAGLFALYTAIGGSSITSILSYAYTLMCAGTLVMFVGGIFWKKGTKAGAISASVIGIFFVILYKFCGVNLPFSAVFPILPSFIAYVVVSLLTQPKGEKKA